MPAIEELETHLCIDFWRGFGRKPHVSYSKLKAWLCADPQQTYRRDVRLQSLSIAVENRLDARGECFLK